MWEVKKEILKEEYIKYKRITLSRPDEHKRIT